MKFIAPSIKNQFKSMVDQMQLFYPSCAKNANHLSIGTGLKSITEHINTSAVF